MTQTTNMRSQILNDACAMIEDMGGVGVLLGDLYKGRGIFARMTKEHDSLVKQYPNKWVAMGMEGVLAVGDSMDEVFSAVDAQGIGRSDVVVEFLDTDPPLLIV